tara:strand:- start:204 stop:464 length:261 start_codon:yes stop_codon:yes gene_type:complete
MNINQLIQIVKKKLIENFPCDKIQIEDKSFLHKNHKSNSSNKFHLKIIIKSNYLKKKNKIESTKEIYKVLGKELKDNIHSIQILIS